ncbi:MAG: dienelactone hydrolase family protein [Acidobacteriota bacterium]
MPLRTLVFAPEPAAAAGLPAVVIIQPFNNPPEYARLLSLELAREGFVVLTFDWRGRTARENRQALRTDALDVMGADVAAAVAYLRKRPEVDPARISVVGHSVGATLAVEAGLDDPSIAAVVAIGMEAMAAPRVPSNLLWVIGLYDEFYGLGRMRACFRESTGAAVPENTTVGDFKDGTARRLAVSLTADHFSELQDKNVHREVVRWLGQAAGLSYEPSGPSMEMHSLLIAATWLTAVVAAILTVLRPGRRWPVARRLAPAAALMGILLLAHVEDQTRMVTADAMLGLLIFGLIAGALCKVPPETLARKLRACARVALTIWISVLLTLLVNAVPAFVDKPGRLASVPEFAIRHLFDLLYAYVLVFPRPYVISHAAGAVVTPRMWVLLVLAVEVAVPGLFLGCLARLINPRGTRVEPRAASIRDAVVLTVLALILAAILWLRFQQGLLTEESALAAGLCILRYALPPIIIFALLSRWTRRMSPNRQPDGGAA